MMPEVSDVARRKILDGMWRSLGETFMEGLLLRRISADPSRIVIDEVSRQAVLRTAAEGAIIAVPHLGNWELATIPLVAAGARHATVYRKPKNPHLDAYILGSRRKLFSGGVFAKGAGAAGRILRHVRSGGSAAIMADLREAGGVQANFFGRPAPSTPFPALLARQYNRPLFVACLIRTAPGRFRLEVEEIAVAQTSDRDRDISLTTQRIQEVFERWIRRWPDQWMWTAKRFD